MKSLVKVLMVLALGAIICMPGMALADFTFTDITTYCDNYPQAYGPPGFDGDANAVAGPVDTIKSFITSGDVTFGGTGLVDTGNGAFAGWTPVKNSSTYASATLLPTPTAQNHEGHTYQFAGTSWDGSAFQIDTNWYLGNQFVLHEVINVGNGPVTGAYNDTQVVPLPPSALLLGSGLLGLVGLGWRRRKTNA